MLLDKYLVFNSERGPFGTHLCCLLETLQFNAYKKVAFPNYYNFYVKEEKYYCNCYITPSEIWVICQLKQNQRISVYVRSTEIFFICEWVPVAEKQKKLIKVNTTVIEKQQKGLFTF